MGKKETAYSFIDSTMFDADYLLKKPQSAKAYFTYSLLRCLRMFEYKNLPDTIQADILEKYLMMNGVACIGKDQNGDLRAFFGNWGGEYDAYYRPSLFIVSNPHIKGNGKNGWFHQYTVFPIDKSTKSDGVLMRNDTAWFGLAPMLSRYSALFAENALTIRVADVMLRIIALLSASSDDEFASAMEYIKSLEKGDLKVISSSPFFEGIKLQSPPSNNGSYLTQFIELHQYLKGSLYNELGLSANYNMKREAIGKGESTLDNDSLLPLCENMLMCRREDIKKVNEMFDTEIEVDFSSSWKENQIERNIQLVSQLEENGNGGVGNVGTCGVNMGQEERTVENDGRSDDKPYTNGDNDSNVDNVVSADSVNSNDNSDDRTAGQNDAASGDDRGTDAGAGKSEVSSSEGKQEAGGENGDDGDSERGDSERDLGTRGDGINDETLVDLTLEKINTIVENSIDEMVEKGVENDKLAEPATGTGELETGASEDIDSNPEK